jgi:hypothetical protein
MRPEDELKAYDVFLIVADGTAEVFQHYPQAVIPV